MNIRDKDKFIITGMVTEVLPNTIFRVKVDSGFENIIMENNEILAHLSGKMRIHRIKVLIGDKVKVEVSKYDLTKGRIVQRF